MSENRRYDGRKNNIKHPLWGSAGSILLRKSNANYDESTGYAARKSDPRKISNTVCFQNNQESPQDLTDFVWAWGQFLDHEIDISPENEEEYEPIVVATGVLLPDGIKEPAEIPFKRSEHEIKKVFNDFELDWDPDSVDTEVREQINALPAFIDGANVYGDSCNRASALRLYDGSGKLKSENNFLPYNHCLLENAMGPMPRVNNKQFFIAGDRRCNEHCVLTSMHTLFMRQHNWLCDKISQKFPSKYKTDEDIYQAARKVVGAQMQVITFDAFLPLLLGDDAIPTYTGYDELCNPSIANEFSTAFYRLGHSMLSDDINLGLTGEKLQLLKMFFNPELLVNKGIEGFLGGLHTKRMQKINLHIVDSVREFLFTPPGTGNSHMFLDLVSLNIQRGRDHGLPGYNACRAAYGLATRDSFNLISSDPKVIHGLSEVYNHPDDIDPWVGALAEDTLEGAAVGELTQAALVDQFTRLRDGDRFWWENDNADILTDAEMGMDVKTITLGKILNANTSGINFPDDVFHVQRSNRITRPINMDQNN